MRRRMPKVESGHVHFAGRYRQQPAQGPARSPYAAGMTDEHLRETTVERRVVHRGRFMTFRVDTIEDAGGVRHPREIVEHPGAVCIIPIAGEDLLMVRQWRTPVERAILELPAGTLDRIADGDTEAAAVVRAFSQVAE